MKAIIYSKCYISHERWGVASIIKCTELIIEFSVFWISGFVSLLSLVFKIFSWIFFYKIVNTKEFQAFWSNVCESSINKFRQLYFQYFAFWNSFRCHFFTYIFFLSWMYFYKVIDKLKILITSCINVWKLFYSEHVKEMRNKTEFVLANMPFINEVETRF